MGLFDAPSRSTTRDHGDIYREKALGERHPDYASALDALARVLLRWEDLEAAEPHLRRALEVRQAVLGVDHPDYAASLDTLADLHSRRAAPEEAEPLLREALAV